MDNCFVEASENTKFLQICLMTFCEYVSTLILILYAPNYHAYQGFRQVYHDYFTFYIQTATSQTTSKVVKSNPKNNHLAYYITVGSNPLCFLSISGCAPEVRRSKKELAGCRQRDSAFQISRHRTSESLYFSIPSEKLAWFVQMFFLIQ